MFDDAMENNSNSRSKYLESVLCKVKETKHWTEDGIFISFQNSIYCCFANK